MKATVLVTGGSGFIGSNLVDRLLSLSFQVVSVDNFDPFYDSAVKRANNQQALQHPHFTSYEVDIRDVRSLESVFEKYSFDMVFHLAGKAGVRPSIANPDSYFDVNVNGTIRLAECMRKYNVKKLIFASSSSVYGNNTKIPFAESDIVDFPISPYAASKKSAELLLHSFHCLHGLDIICLRFFTVFGPRQRPDLAIHHFFHHLYAEKPIPVYGDGSTSRDYTYIDDILSGIVSAAEYLQNRCNVFEIINLGNHSPISLINLIQLIESVTGRKFQLHFLPMQAGDVERTYADIQKGNTLLGYSPQTTLDVGLHKFRQWFEKNST